MTETIDAEIVESQELVPREAAAPTLFNTDDPQLIIAKASGVAKVLKDVIVKQKMAMRIGQSEYIKVEGWTTLGALLGVCPRVEFTEAKTFAYIDPTTGDAVQHSGWEASVEVVNAQGDVISRAEAQCDRGEKNWKNRDDFALRSMAQTRAMGKALRMLLGWIAVLAGYEATPAEEMPAVVSDDVPFDKTGPQGPDADGMKAHGEHATGTGASITRAEALEARRVELTDRLLELSALLGKRVVTETAIAKDRIKNEAKPASHLTWLEKQVATAEKHVEAMNPNALPLGESS